NTTRSSRYSSRGRKRLPRILFAAGRRRVQVDVEEDMADYTSRNSRIHRSTRKGHRGNRRGGSPAGERGSFRFYAFARTASRSEGAGERGLRRVARVRPPS